VTLGHNSLKFQKAWHGNLTKCFFGARNKTIIFNFKSTLNYLIKAVYAFTLITKSNGDVLFVNTNPELSKLLYHIRKNTTSPHLFFSDCGWIKGTLTNWSMLSHKVKTFITFYNDFDSFLNENNIHFPNYKKMKKSYKGFLTKQNKSQISNYKYNKDLISEKKILSVNNFNSTVWPSVQTASNAKKTDIFKLSAKWRPSVIILISTENTESIIKEASSLNIPTIAILDSNSNISNITYPISTNTYYYPFIWFFSSLITKLSNKYSN
jgi:ribosomal protein S2